MTESALFIAFYGLILAVPLVFYLGHQRRKESRARDAAAKGELFTEGPRGQHPHIDVTNCIGCQGCTAACPEGTVLGMVGGKAAMIQPHRCIGHGLCAEACPVGAITLRTAGPSLSADLPVLSEENETSVSNLFIAGELGGLALIRNAVRQGRECIDTIAARLSLARIGDSSVDTNVYDVLIIGAGPAGMSAAMRAVEHGLNYLVIEREDIGGTVARYPRQKVVMTSPFDFPLHGRINKMKMSKEHLIEFLTGIAGRPDFRSRLNEPVESVQRSASGVFTVRTATSEYQGRAVILAMGRGGTPRKLGAKGENLPKVMYRLIEADHYTNKRIMVVGGGDSAVEAAVGLSMQPGNEVILSYRKDAFSRIKQRNQVNLDKALRSRQLKVIFNSNPVEFTESSVLLDIEGVINPVPNDFVWIFAGGVAPNDFLKKCGVSFGRQDLTVEARREGLLSKESTSLAAVPSAH